MCLQGPEVAAGRLGQLQNLGGKWQGEVKKTGPESSSMGKYSLLWVSWHPILLLEIYGVRSETFIHSKWLVPLCACQQVDQNLYLKLFLSVGKKLPIPLKEKTKTTSISPYLSHETALRQRLQACVGALPLLGPIKTWTHLCHLKCHTESSTNDLVTSRNIRFTKDRKTFLIISRSTGCRKELGVGGRWDHGRPAFWE